MRNLLLIAGILFSAISISSCKEKSPLFKIKEYPKANNAGDSGKSFFMVNDYLVWKDADSMIKAYNASPYALKVRTSDSTIETLGGLQLDADFIRAMLVDANVKKIELYFAVNKSEITAPQADQTFTIITAPVIFDPIKRKYTVKKYRDNLGSRTNSDNSELVDFCDPCPKNCPDTTQL